MPSKYAVQKELMRDVLGAYVFQYAPWAEWITDTAKCLRTLDTRLEAIRAAFIQQQRADPDDIRGANMRSLHVLTEYDPHIEQMRFSNEWYEEHLHAQIYDEPGMRSDLNVKV